MKSRRRSEDYNSVNSSPKTAFVLFLIVLLLVACGGGSGPNVPNIKIDELENYAGLCQLRNYKNPEECVNILPDCRSTSEPIPKKHMFEAENFGKVGGSAQFIIYKVVQDRLIEIDRRSEFLDAGERLWLHCERDANNRFVVKVGAVSAGFALNEGPQGESNNTLQECISVCETMDDPQCTDASSVMTETMMDGITFLLHRIEETPPIEITYAELLSAFKLTGGDCERDPILIDEDEMSNSGATACAAELDSEIFGQGMIIISDSVEAGIVRSDASIRVEESGEPGIRLEFMDDIWDATLGGAFRGAQINRVSSSPFRVVVATDNGCFAL